ncbi:unnamed protein product [Prorocentrum cordatum]|uniref:Uncharacterized protein n=1 Tax=Prorocentrum cordatum TaxID=2364126 RepID=A0ABN9QFM9_9DINO|nr:unnamed protein product [Polarella glacialis]
MLGPRAKCREGEAALAEQRDGKRARADSDRLSSAPTRCPTSELPAFGDDQDADAHKESWGAAAVPRDGDELALLGTAFIQAVPSRDGRPRMGVAMPAPRVAPLRRLRSEAFWEQQAAAARRSVCSPWEFGVRQRRPCLDERDCLRPAAVAAPEEEGAGGAGAARCPRSWAGAVSRELRRGARGSGETAAPPPGSPSAAFGAALRLSGRS